MQALRRLLLNIVNHPGAAIRIVGLGLLLRLVLLWVLADQPLVSDSLYYQEMAIELMQGEDFSPYWPPGLPLYEAAVMTVFGEGDFVLRLAMLPWFLLLCWFLYDLLYRMHSREAANIALIFGAFYPALVHHSIEPLTQLPAASLLLGTFYFFYRFLKRKSWSYVLQMATCLALLVLFRPSALLFVVLMPIMIFLQSRKFLQPTLVFLISGSLVTIWVWEVSGIKGRFVPINEANTRNFYLGNNPWTPHYKTWYYGSNWVTSEGQTRDLRHQLDSLDALPDSIRSKAFMQTGLTYIGKRPDIFLLRSLNRIRTFFAFDSFTGARLTKPPNAAPVLGYLVLGIDALFYMLIGGLWIFFLGGMGKIELETRYVRLSFALIILYTLPYIISFSHPTYHVPLLPLLMLPASVVMLRILEEPAPRKLFARLSARKKRRLYILFVVFFLVQIEWIVQMAGGIFNFAP